MIALFMQPGKGLQQGNPLLINRGYLYKCVNRIFTLAHSIPAIVVAICVRYLDLFLMQNVI